MSNEICGYENTTTGEPCQNSPGENGFCYIPSHNPGENGENPQGRPTKLDKARQENIASMIEEGHSMSAAARANDITVQTFFNWMERGAQEEETIFAAFFERITRARGYGEKQYVDALIDIAKDNDDTATLMTLLKSRYPDSWGDAKRGEQAAGVHVHTDAAETTEIDPETLEVKD